MEDGEEGEDVEIKLQRDSSRIIQTLKVSIPLFLRRNRPGTRSHGRLRKHVKQGNVEKILRLVGAGLLLLFNCASIKSHFQVDIFQEWPQLLDPILEQLVTPIISAYVEYIQHYSSFYRTTLDHAEEDFEPLPRAICKILYMLCKVRGPKVITRFFSNEPAFLEPMLDAFELWNGYPDSAVDPTSPNIVGLTWEEKYVMLLWLSHLSLTPFNLASISTPGVGTKSPLPGEFFSPEGLPDVAHRLLALGLRYFSAASKERESAVLLLVRLSLRPDMQQLFLHQHCMHWALSSLKNGEKGNAHVPIYFYTGILSYLAGFFRSGDSQTVGPFMVSTFQCMQDINDHRASRSIDILGSTVVRKLIVKIHRHLAMHLLSGFASNEQGQIDDSALLNSIFDHLLSSLGDNDGPVRFTASKALSVVAQRLDPDMTVQLVDDIAEKLQENTSFEQPESFDRVADIHPESEAVTQRNLSAVDPFHWHGLVLTLSHLLYRHSAPDARLSIIIDLLVYALDFEQRSPMGVSIGTGVRDAACFGIWSLARKYSTKELLLVAPSSVRARASCRYSSVIEALATELVVTATLDPEGNIRRGASAALQELVGRHPDLVPSGIRLIQIVDYHAVGLRSRALTEVTMQAAAFNNIYLQAISAGLLSWRAINSPTTAIRHDAASVIGHVFRLYGSNPSFLFLFRHFDAIDRSRTDQSGCGTKRTIEEWHGLYLALAALISEGCFEESSLIRYIPSQLGDVILLNKKEASVFGMQQIIAHGKSAELAIEALCSILAAVSVRSKPGIIPEQVKYHVIILEACIKHCKEQSLELVKKAAVSIMAKLNEGGRQNLVRGWLTDIQEGRNNQLRSGGSNVNLITVVGAVLQQRLQTSIPRELIALQVNVLVSQMNKESKIESRCVALRSLFMPIFLQCKSVIHYILVRRSQSMAAGKSKIDLTNISVWLILLLGRDWPNFQENLKSPLVDCLQDYTIDSRGDIGSEIRIAATEVINMTSATLRWDHSFTREAFGIVYALAVEKLDKVRDCAWNCIRRHLNVLVLEEDQ